MRSITGFLLILILSSLLTACTDNVDKDPALTDTFITIAQNLTLKSSCAEKSDYLADFVSEKIERIRDEKQDFESRCPASALNAMSCRSNLILAVSMVQIAIRGCSETASLTASVDTLNTAAETGILCE